MEKKEIEKIELDLLLEAIFQRYGYEFKNYARASINRRIRQFLYKSEFNKITEMTQKLLYDDTFFAELVKIFSITVTEMFRDPEFYQALRKRIIPFLKTYPFVKIWHAGCATGEEVYSMAIILKEENFYDKATIYATDFNDDALKKAKEGVYSISHIKKFTSNYQKAGGKESFSKYYHAKYESAIIDNSLKQNITFANHNLTTDSVFSDMHLIICRNTLIYFNKHLQERVLQLFRDSLIYNGFLSLGNKESLKFSNIYNYFIEIDKKEKIYQKKAGAIHA